MLVNDSTFILSTRPCWLMGNNVAMTLFSLLIFIQDKNGTPHHTLLTWKQTSSFK